ncbi:tyrosine-type recombinase/integrase [Peribacillus frigoritolerans]|uniref:tyrosine-type recombinase/integrase n=1 Tax=Peribacillus frigoritolerans TaxID=450367 RepID=UPI003511274B
MSPLLNFFNDWFTQLVLRRFYDLRHTHATIMLEIGENSKVVSERLGHSKVSITLDKYSHVTQNIQDSSAENFSKALGIKSMDQ